MQEQIEEMAFAMCKNVPEDGICYKTGFPCEIECVYGACAKSLYKNDYRKKSDTVREIFAEIEKIYTDPAIKLSKEELLRALRCFEAKPKKVCGAHDNEVVRCKDCEHFLNDTKFCKENNKHYCEYDDTIHADRDFCNKGERRGEE